MKSIILRHFIFLSILAPLYFASMASAAMPECKFRSSDPDTDGFGWENNQTCIVSANSSAGTQSNSAGECIDDNADGWGWNGETSCQVSIAPIMDNCADTNPIGDGWGWNGVTSCRVVPVSDQFNEIRELREHFGVDHNFHELQFEKAVAIQCPNPYLENLKDAFIYLFYDGKMRLNIEGWAHDPLNDLGVKTYRGHWVGGMSETDGAISLIVIRNGATNGANITISEDGVRWGNRLNCQWVAP